MWIAVKWIWENECMEKKTAQSLCVFGEIVEKQASMCCAVLVFSSVTFNARACYAIKYHHQAFPNLGTECTWTAQLYFFDSFTCRFFSLFLCPLFLARCMFSKVKKKLFIFPPHSLCISYNNQLQKKSRYVKHRNNTVASEKKMCDTFFSVFDFCANNRHSVWIYTFKRKCLHSINRRTRKKNYARKTLIRMEIVRWMVKDWWAELRRKKFNHI